ncbi:MAG: hypothetical protein GXO78_13060 [Calditrichaeota bacterium]|nr:hypothetical protein [Calditrichota bacterium]
MNARKSTYPFFDEKGASLLEMVFVLVLLGVVLSVSLGFMNVSARMMVDVFQRSFFATEADRAWIRLRQDFAGLSRQDILEIQEDRIRIRRSKGRPIEYRYRRGVLYRDGEVFLTHLRGFPFRLLDAQKKETRDRDQVAYVQIRLQFQQKQFRWQRQGWYHVAD